MLMNTHSTLSFVWIKIFTAWHAMSKTDSAINFYDLRFLTPHMCWINHADSILLTDVAKIWPDTSLTPHTFSFDEWLSYQHVASRSSIMFDTY